jgi:hypothetical protein
MTAKCFAQDSTMPFKYEGDDKWLTKTEFVRQYDKDLSQLDFYDSAYAELEKQIKLYSSIIDSMKDQAAMYRRIIDAKNEIIAVKQTYINELEKPREIKAKDRGEGTSLFSYEGLYFNLGAYYRFENQSITKENILNSIRYFGSLEAGWLLFNKVKFNLEVIIPAEIKLKGGIKL